MRKEEIVELNGPPEFDIGDKVRSLKLVRNDGTYPMSPVGEVLIAEGDVGYINSIGTYLQQFYIYGVDFFERGRIVGMRAKELEYIDED
ncbi:MAG TPA: nitrogen fixation protein NifZ [Candidatus Sulfotelmatobacter sp.]|jgi:nitrogen fixation protein NifZ|nr:nitrogen fixation protein NifZ [Candidatus Sulfotelmatobacter sp.]